MSSKTRILAFALAFAFMAGFAFSAQADVTGSFTTSVRVEPQTTATEMGALNFDIENALDLSVVISGLSTTLHSHFGLAGVEDVILGYAATLGALDINGEFVFGRFAASCWFFGGQCFDRFGNAINGTLPNTAPQSTRGSTDNMRFVKKRVKTSISLGGVSFENLAIIEDVTTNGLASVAGLNTFSGPEQLFQTGGPFLGNFGFVNSSSWGQTPQYAFGDVITLSGQTPSGVSIEASTGICAENVPNVIKKHSWQYRVNPTCGGQSFLRVFTDFAEEDSTGNTPSNTIEDDSQDLSVSANVVEGGDNDGLTEEGETWDVVYTFQVRNGGSVGAAPTFLHSQMPSLGGNGTVTMTKSGTACTAPISDGTSCTASFTFGTNWGDPANSNTQENLGSLDVSMTVQHTAPVGKPNLLFDFETLNITGVPVASGITANAKVRCNQTTQCSLTNTFLFSSTGPVPFSTSFFFSDLFSLTFTGAKLSFNLGAGSLDLFLAPSGVLDEIDLNVSTTINPDTNPATLDVALVMLPGSGIDEADVDLSIERSNVTFAVGADFEGVAGGSGAEFDDVTFSVGTTAGAIDVSTEATFGRFGFVDSETSFTINF